MENYSAKDIAPAAERVRAPNCEIDSRLLHTCPYNKNHKVPRNKLELHLVKCMEEYGPCGLKICTYNFIHHVPEQEFEQHLRVCPDKIRAFAGFIPPSPQPPQKEEIEEKYDGQRNEVKKSGDKLGKGDTYDGN